MTGIKYFITLFSMFLLTAACVTVKVGSAPATKATSFSFIHPPEPFQNIDTPGADEAWQDRKTGSTISYNTVCNETSDPSLEVMKSNLLQAISRTQILSQKNTMMNGREALDVTVRGDVDGVSIQMQLMLFKKNDCNYHLSYVAVPKHFHSQQNFYLDFVKGFSVP